MSLMPKLAGLTALCCAVPALLAGQTGQFLVRLGTDTLALEQYTRTADRLEGEQVLRAPRTVHRLYSARFAPRGVMTHFELVTHNVSGAPGPAETRATMDFVGDSAVAQVPGRDSSITVRAKPGPGAVPFVGQVFALVEDVVRRARLAGGERYATAMLPLGDTAAWPVTVTPRGSDSLTIVLGPVGALRARVDREGTLLGLSGVGSTMQVTVDRVHGLDFAALSKAFAPRSLGPLSPSDSVTATISGATVSVHYSRPATRGRVIFGNVVPWNQVWRTGANEATVFATSADLVVAGITLPAGKYTLWTLPSPTGWRLIVNKNTGQWGTAYDARYDFARLDLHVEGLPQLVEQFTIGIEPRGEGGVLSLAWERTRASIPFARK